MQVGFGLQALVCQTLVRVSGTPGIMQCGDGTEDTVFWKPSGQWLQERAINGIKQVESQEGRESAIGCKNALVTAGLYQISFPGAMRAKARLKWVQKRRVGEHGHKQLFWKVLAPGKRGCLVNGHSFSINGSMIEQSSLT